VGNAPEGSGFTSAAAPSPCKSPDQQVAETIAREIEKAGLVPKARLPQLELSMANGQLRPEDWKFLLELPVTEVQATDAKQDP
jgi:hypothetical protein